ncbi:hypothetical protein TpMuguga_03g00768 [Theileria parva strain Muguga]|uniref:Uncharacterized protein n=1 Tax=Theileria parva TaxID=5875 RepID=Q4MYS3_THEPA|nr:uncharacterized protein TpMuguga_03g00768 [Theileria parva strain Muguga]EAN30609.1 hypothetical protein TpMuguga_03g00768 [Theileria parva strain Muguga]|eukprot:XP_762892.1 hypothetical protein [Theileria parva strain Muguga]
MNNADDLYSVVTGSHLSDPGKCSEISAFLLQLLSKDYNSISSTYDKLLNDDEKLRRNLHNFVLDSAPIALKNINYSNNSFQHVENLSRTAFDISKSSSSISHKATELKDSLSRVVSELTEINSEYSDYKYLNTLLTFLNEFELKSDYKNLPFLLSLNQVLNSIPDAKESKLGTFLLNKVKGLLSSVESELFKSFSNDYDENAKTIELIKKIGLSSAHDVSVGFLKNRFDYLSNCFKSCINSAKTNAHSSLQGAVNTLKNIYPISLTYKNVFGDIDVYLSTFVNRAFQEFIDTVTTITRSSEFTLHQNLNLSGLDSEIINLSNLLAPLGLSFHIITNFTFTSLLTHC